MDLLIFINTGLDTKQLTGTKTLFYMFILCINI